MNLTPWCGDYTMYEGNRWYLTKNQFRTWVRLDTSIVKDSKEDWCCE